MHAGANAKVAYLTSDHLGSPRINTDANGAVISRHDYHPFGEEIATSQRTAHLGYSEDTVRKQFTGYERDNETDLDFAQARMYNPMHGRFTSPDDFRNDSDVRDPQSWNLYIYVRNKPLMMVDPTGMMGDYYDSDGRWLAHDGKDDQKVYFARLMEDRGAEVDLYADSIRETTLAAVLNAQNHAAGIGSATENPIGDFLGGFAEQADSSSRAVRIAATTAGVIGTCAGTAGAGCAPAVRIGTAIIQSEMEAAQTAAAENTNPFAGPVIHPVTIVDSNGNAIRVETNQQTGGSPNGDFIQVKDAQGNPTGLRKDGPHNPRTHSDPRAQVPHGHIPGVKNRDGTPWIKIKK